MRADEFGLLEVACNVLTFFWSEEFFSFPFFLYMYYPGWIIATYIPTTANIFLQSSVQIHP